MVSTRVGDHRGSPCADHFLVFGAQNKRQRVKFFIYLKRVPMSFKTWINRKSRTSRRRDFFSQFSIKVLGNFQNACFISSKKHEKDQSVILCQRSCTTHAFSNMFFIKGDVFRGDLFILEGGHDYRKDNT